MARDKSVPTSYRIALGQVKRYFGDKTPDIKELKDVADTIAKKNKIDDSVDFIRYVQTKIVQSIPGLGKQVKESVEYKEFISKEAKSKGYDSIGEIPKDKLDDFYLEIDKKWNSKEEDGKDGANESFDILEASDKSSLIKRYTKNLEDVKKSYSTKDGLDSTRNDEYIAYAQAQLDAVKKDGLDGLLALWNKKK